MPTETSIQLRPGELGQIVESVFAAMLSLEAEACEVPWFPDAERLTATVRLSGNWNGAILLECDRGPACRFAGRFLSSDAPAEVDDVVRDMLGEMVNMIGGNMKAVLTSGLQVSMPWVVEGSGHGLPVTGAEIGERLTFRCAEGLFWITVLVQRR